MLHPVDYLFLFNCAYLPPLTLVYLVEIWAIVKVKAADFIKDIDCIKKWSRLLRVDILKESVLIKQYFQPRSPFRSTFYLLFLTGAIVVYIRRLFHIFEYNFFSGFDQCRCLIS